MRRLMLAPLPAQVDAAAEELSSGCRHTAQEAGSSIGARRFCGSRFWALSDQVSSDEEDGEQVSERAPPACSSPDTGLVTLGTQHTKVCHSGSGAGSDGARVSKELTLQRSPNRSKTKPWRGPLPAKRVSPRRTLGDVLGSAKVCKLSKCRHCPRRRQLFQSRRRACLPRQSFQNLFGSFACR